MWFTAGIALLDVLFAWAVFAGRRGDSRAHRTVFGAGLAGLVALPLWFVGLIEILGQFFFADIMSPAGILLVVTTAVITIALAFVFYGMVRLVLARKGG